MIATATPALHPAHAYAEAVVDRRIVACKAVLAACRRHLDDLEHGEKRAGLWFDEEAADRIARFAACLNLVEGEAAGQPIILEPWQHFCLGSVFGWMRDDGLRRYRESWIRVGRGNFKSGLAAIVGLYCAGWDGYYGRDGRWKAMQGAQVFAVATKLAQAAIVHKVAIRMAKESPYASARLRLPESKLDRIVRCRIIHPETGSFFEPLGRDSKTEDGWAPVCAILDEVHAFGDGGMWDVMESAMVKRAQPLMFAITTAGYGGASSFGMLQDTYFKKALDPQTGRVNDRAFVYIAELEPRTRCTACAGQPGQDCSRCDGRGYTGDDYTDPGTWGKANPNLGVSVYVDGLRARVEKAQESPRDRADVLVKNFNMWQRSGLRGISIEVWDACGLAAPMPPEAELRRRPCFAGLDLGSNKDLLALVLYWPICGEWRKAAVKPFFWVAEDTVPIRLKEDRMDYRPWIEAGEIVTTQGEFTDQNEVRKKLNLLAESYTIKKVGADRKFGEKLLPELQQDGFEVVRIAQSPANLCPPWQTLERLIGRGELAHGGHGVLREHASNVVLETDGELEWPSKGKAEEKIDGIAALIDAILLAMATPYDGPVRPPEIHPLPARRGGGRRAILDAFK